MFKIIKTSTYNRLVRQSEQRQELIDSLRDTGDFEGVCTWDLPAEEVMEINFTLALNKVDKLKEDLYNEVSKNHGLESTIEKLKLQLHHLTAKKLPIKKSKNK